MKSKFLLLQARTLLSILKYNQSYSMWLDLVYVTQFLNMLIIGHYMFFIHSLIDISAIDCKDSPSRILTLLINPLANIGDNIPLL